MNKDQFTYLLQHPQQITVTQTNDINSIIEKYPYFQPARALYLKGLKNKDSFKYNQELKITAAYTTDRSILFDYITSDTFNQNEISQQIKQNSDHLKDIYVNEFDDISINRSVEIDDALKEQIKSTQGALDPDLFIERMTIGTIANFNIESEEKTDELEKKNEDIKPEEVLNIGKPLEFDRSETHSFAEWLKITSFKPIIREPEEKKEPEKVENESSIERKFELIDKFLESNPKIIPSKESNTQNLAKAQPAQNDGLMTETLARIYLEQKNYEKAIQSYKILSLKYPEKSGFFADQIKAVKQLQEKNNI
ncbi:hypothetical protein M0G43_06030 [Subsaxibacter sp. CAU 1640]|uniref:hypothetical protein n=1 Tax=Subsaxibacter sp. CAU 1640 TaxID=2933271 RepID=UPI0020034377|nr:hypothetical protein [Subsaxibacter sp. CAU 1640]MCK7590122.1 hypothetical protein [Subsaxibacter sp. CAU 1640]